MKGKLITLQHHADDYECMWNGIEDLYIQATGETLPPSFFFILSAFGSFCYMKTPKSDLKRMIALVVSAGSSNGDPEFRDYYEYHQEKLY